MWDRLIASLLGALAIQAVTSGAVGLAMARRSSRRPWHGLIAGAVLPWIGLLVPAVLWGPSRMARRPPVRDLKARAALTTTVIGAALIATSAFMNWVTVSGHFASLSEALEGGIGQAFAGAMTVIATSVSIVILAVVHFAWGGLRFAAAGLWITATLSSLLLLALALSGVAETAAGLAVALSAGQAEAHVQLGVGALTALAGSALGLIGSMAAVLHSPDGAYFAPLAPGPAVRAGLAKRSPTDASHLPEGRTRPDTTELSNDGW